MKRRAAREIAFQLTYEMVMTGEYNDETKDELLGDADLDARDYVNSIVNGIVEHNADIKNVIVKYAKGYEYDRIYKADLALLFVACYEIMYTKTPPAAVANEAVEIAKIYSDVKSHAFINGILASVIANEGESANG
ncbi:MAG: transcription antitermination factor NusB [Clostridiales bacterium]|nr:transcription antitermination factor NusB [Clostridiales bacterium]